MTRSARVGDHDLAATREELGRNSEKRFAQMVSRRGVAGLRVRVRVRVREVASGKLALVSFIRVVCGQSEAT